MIDHYVQAILTPWLHARGLPVSAVPQVADDVRNRLLSALSRWNTIDYRRTLLLPAREEAVFYEPRAVPLDIRALVVLCVRNSLVEDWCSVAAGRESPLNDADVIDLTQTAMTYFAKHVAHLEIPAAVPQPDPFGALPTRYPAAWRALAVLSALPDGLVGVEYDPVPPRRTALPLPHRDPRWRPLPRAFVELSGLSPVIDPDLGMILKDIAEDQVGSFFSHNFKMITRNPDKLLSILEFVLACGKPVVTLNYYLSNGLVLRRRRLWRPAHGLAQMEAQLLDRRLLTDLAPQHRALLRSVQAMAGLRVQPGR